MSKSNANIESLVETLSKEVKFLEQELAEIRAQIEPLKNKCVELVENIRGLKNQRDELKLSLRPDPNEIDFDVILSLNGHEESSVLYRERERQLALLHLHPSGYWADTGQKAIQITLTKNSDAKTKAVFDGLCLVLPHIIPDEDGYRRISIFESTLSQYGSWQLVGLTDNENGEFLLLCNRREKKRFPNLMEALIYCQKNCWYEED